MYMDFGLSCGGQLYSNTFGSIIGALIVTMDIIVKKYTYLFLLHGATIYIRF